METLIIILAGALGMVATYLVLSKGSLRVVVGMAMLTHAGHLLLMAMGGLKTGSAPLLGENAAAYTDALPQALILTSIVINFGVTAFFLVLVYHTYQAMGTDNLDSMRGFKK